MNETDNSDIIYLQLPFIIIKQQMTNIPCNQFIEFRFTLYFSRMISTEIKILNFFHNLDYNQCTYYPISGHLSVFTAGQKVWNMNIQTSSRWPMLVNRRSIVFLRAKTLGEKNHPRVDKCRRPLHMKAIIVYCKKSIINQMYCTNIA